MAKIRLTWEEYALLRQVSDAGKAGLNPSALSDDDKLTLSLMYSFEGLVVWGTNRVHLSLKGQRALDQRQPDEKLARWKQAVEGAKSESKQP